MSLETAGFTTAEADADKHTALEFQLAAERAKAHHQATNSKLRIDGSLTAGIVGMTDANGKLHLIQGWAGLRGI